MTGNTSGASSSEDGKGTLRPGVTAGKSRGSSGELWGGHGVVLVRGWWKDMGQGTVWLPWGVVKPTWVKLSSWGPYTRGGM